MNPKNRIWVCALVVLTLVSIYGCGRPFPLRKADDEINALAFAMGDWCFNEEKAGTDITPTLLEWKSLMDEIYQGELTPQTTSGSRSIIDEGLEIEAYPTDASVTGATLGVPLEASLDIFIQALLWPNWLEVFTDPQRYFVYEREYPDGEEKRDKFLAKEVDFLDTENYQEDVGQRGVSFAYTTSMKFYRFKEEDNPELPQEGVLVVCNKMLDEEAENVTGQYNAYMTDLYSFNIYYAVDGNKTYKINGTWLRAGGSLWIFGASANSGNVGQGIIDEQTSLWNFIENNLL